MTARPSGARTAERPRSPEPGDVADLASASRSHPCISLLMPTSPGPRMAPEEVAQLRLLVEEVDRKLRTEHAADRSALMHRLAQVAARVAAQPTDRGLAIYLSSDVERVFRLPLAPPPRSVVERTFATRALFTVLHRMPPYVLLVLHPTCAHLYQGGDGSLRPVGERTPFRGRQVPRQRRDVRPAEGTTAADETEDFLRDVDKLLGIYRADHPSPLVLAGAPPLVERYRQLSRHLQRYAGAVPPGADDTARDLAVTSAEVVVRYLASRRDEALARLRGALASRPGDVARGMAQCWLAVHREPPGLLLVEEGYVRPGRLQDLTNGVAGAAPSRAGDGVHDLVDDLMEVTILRGGQLALVEDGDLAAHGRVALVSGSAEPAPPGRGTTRS